MRIIGGKWKGHRIVVPKGSPARPTTDMARESLFNILNNEFEWEGLRCMDLFAGTGAVGLELVSRGVRSVLSVERNKKLVQSIQQNCKELGCENLQVVQREVEPVVRGEHEAPYDIIFADPPYHMKGYVKLIEEILEGGLLSEIGILIVEHDSRNDFSQMNRFREIRVYGNVRFSIFE